MKIPFNLQDLLSLVVKEGHLTERSCVSAVATLVPQHITAVRSFFLFVLFTAPYRLWLITVLLLLSSSTGPAPGWPVVRGGAETGRHYKKGLFHFIQRVKLKNPKCSLALRPKSLEMSFLYPCERTYPSFRYEKNSFHSKRYTLKMFKLCILLFCLYTQTSLFSKHVL